jgi:putative glycosyltransferase (TIGR04372 family)
MICSETGLNIIPQIFRKPIVFVNYILLNLLIFWHEQSVFIPKKFLLKKENRILTFKEIINSRLGTNPNDDYYNVMGIELIENTPEEIRDVAIEMHQRLQGTFIETEEDRALQERFWSEETWGRKVFKSNHMFIGTQFLRDHKHLLT